QSIDGRIASTAVARGVRAALRQSRAGSRATMHCLGATDVSSLALAAALRRPLSGSSTTPRGKTATGLLRAHVQSILDGSAGARALAGLIIYATARVR